MTLDFTSNLLRARGAHPWLGHTCHHLCCRVGTLPNSKNCQVSREVDEGLTETRTGKINDRPTPFAVGLKSRPGEARTLTSRLECGLSCWNTANEPGGLPKHYGHRYRRCRIDLRIVGCGEDRYDPKQQQDFDPAFHTLWDAGNSLAKVRTCKSKNLASTSDLYIPFYK